MQIAGYLRRAPSPGGSPASVQHGKKLPVIIKPPGNGSGKLRIGQTDAIQWCRKTFGGFVTF